MYNRKSIKKYCRHCEKDLEVGKDICTKKSFTSTKTVKRPATRWYHVECAKRLNII